MPHSTVELLRRPSRRVCFWVLLGLIALTAAALAPGVASAHSSSGVHADPGSPASKEYAIPLAVARHSDSGSRSSGLFGQGITKGGGSGRGGPPAGSAGPSGGGSSQVAVRVIHPAPGSGITWMLGMAAIVLLIGAVGGLLILSRGRRRAPRAG